MVSGMQSSFQDTGSSMAYADDPGNLFPEFSRDFLHRSIGVLNCIMQDGRLQRW